MRPSPHRSGSARTPVGITRIPGIPGIPGIPEVLVAAAAAVSAWWGSSAAIAHPPAGIAVHPDGRVTWIDGGSWRLMSVDGAAAATGDSVVEPIPPPAAGSAGPPHRVVRGRDGRVFIADEAIGTIHEVRGGRLEPWLPGGEPPSGSIGRDGHPFAIDTDGTVWWVEQVPGLSCRVMRKRPGQPPEIVAGGAVGHADGTGAAARFTSLHEGSMAWTPDGALVVSDGRRWLRRIDPDVSVRTIAGTASEPGQLRDGPLGEAGFGSLGAVAVDEDGAIVVVDAGHGCLRRIDAAGVVRTIGGLESDDRGQPRPRVRFAAPAGVAVDGRGGIWVLDHADAGTEAVRLTGDGHRVRRIRFGGPQDGPK